MMNQSKWAYREHDINRQYDSQHGYGVRESYYGNGQYPPDWASRREAVWEKQKYQCGRCGVYKGDVSVSEVHHITHLSDGGSNRLSNLVGLCGNCHALMHPDNKDLRGSPWQADLFPDGEADQRVAVIRQSNGDEELETDLQRLSQLSSPDTNAKAVTSATIPTDAEMAKQAEDELPNILINNGFVPRVTPYHRVAVSPKPNGLLATITPRDVKVDATSDGPTTEIEESSDTFNVYHTADTGHSEIKIEDPAGDERSHRLELELEEGERLRVQSPISGPPFTLRTLPEYTLGALQYFGWNSLKIGVIPGLIVAFLLPFSFPGSESLWGAAAIGLILGSLFRSPNIYKDMVGSPTKQVINERTE